MTNEEIKDLIDRMLSGDINAIEQFFKEYQSKTYKIAYHLTKDEHGAENLCQDGLIELIWGKLVFSVELKDKTVLVKDLDKGNIPKDLRREFKNYNRRYSLSKNPDVSVEKRNSQWQIADSEKAYRIRREDDKLNIYSESRLAKWKPTGSFDAWLNMTFRRLCIDILKKTQAKNLISMEEGTIRKLLSDVDINPENTVLRREKRQAVQDCFSSLNNDHREVLQLKYIEGMSQKETTEVLDIPKTTVNMRLYHAREELRECLKKLYPDLF